MASDAPVTCVSWCQADAFCRDVGKRLCGQIGGGSTDYNVTDSAQAQWFNACSLGGEMTGCVLATTEPASVASSATCQTTAGVYDLLGSVQEWIDSCQTGTDKCRYRGGSFTSPEPGSCSWYNYFNRFAQYQNIGFRCCSNP
jgi:formylglycine-generating enzyme required for sulfatase activity